MRPGISSIVLNSKEESTVQLLRGTRRRYRGVQYRGAVSPRTAFGDCCVATGADVRVSGAGAVDALTAEPTNARQSRSDGTPGEASSPLLRAGTGLHDWLALEGGGPSMREGAGGGAGAGIDGAG